MTEVCEGETGNMMVKRRELKRGPFCGGLANVEQMPFNPDDIRSRKWIVGCDGKNGSLCPGYIYKCSPFYVTREYAIEYWNTRPSVVVLDEI